VGRGGSRVVDEDHHRARVGQDDSDVAGVGCRLLDSLAASGLDRDHAIRRDPDIDCGVATSPSHELVLVLRTRREP
jgi:hypothetical protein